MTEMTENQEKLLRYVYKYRQQNGMSPTFSEMATNVGVYDNKSIDYLLKVLEQGGFLERTPGRARSTKLTEQGYEFCDSLSGGVINPIPDEMDVVEKPIYVEVRPTQLDSVSLLTDPETTLALFRPLDPRDANGSRSEDVQHDIRSELTNTSFTSKNLPREWRDLVRNNRPSLRNTTLVSVAGTSLLLALLGGAVVGHAMLWYPILFLSMALAAKWL